MDRILVAGASGYLGKFLLKELHKRGYPVRALVRDSGRLQTCSHLDFELFEGEITKADSITGCCSNIGAVISTVGITRQKDGLSYMDVDYQANSNLLKEAETSGVKKFMYVSVLAGHQMPHLEICKAKERFVAELNNSPIDSCVIRPNGFFSDMADFFEMAKRGRVYLFGKGHYRTNPIHGADLAIFCVDAIESSDIELEVGGPQTLTHNDIANCAFAALKKPAVTTSIPDWVRVLVIQVLRICTRRTFYGPLEFFLTVMARDMSAPEYGTHTLAEYFNERASNSPIQ